MQFPAQQSLDFAKPIADVLRAGLPLPQPEADAFVQKVGEAIPTEKVIDLIYSLLPFIRSCDWDRYLAEERLPTQELPLVERKMVPHEGATSEDDVENIESSAVGKEIRRRWGEHESWAAKECPVVQRLEALMGADHEAIANIAEAVGPTTDAFLFFPDLPTRLREALPTTPQPFRHDYAAFLHRLLRAVGRHVRSQRQIVIECGRELGLLFPEEIDSAAGTYRYRQAQYLVEDRLAASPDDLAALAWLAELSLRRHDCETASALAGRLWSVSDVCPPTELARLVHFSVAYFGDYDDPTFDGGMPLAGELGRLRGAWLGRDVPFAHALLRRAFATDRWNADLVVTVVQLALQGEEFSDDTIPPEGWVWAAHSSGPAGMNYYREWENALAAAEARGDGSVVALAVPILIAGAMRERWDGRYGEWLETLRSHATTPGSRRAAAKVVSGISNFKRHLPPAAKVTLARLTAEFAADLSPSADVSSADADAVRNGLLDVGQHEEFAVNQIGRSVWDRLSAGTRENICQALGLYQSFQQAEGDKRDYGLVFVALAKALVGEIGVQFSTALRCDFFRRSDASRSLGDLCYRLRDLDQPGPNQLARLDSDALHAFGIRLKELVAFVPDMRRLVGARNKGAHESKFDREQAAVLYSAWFIEGRLRRLFEALHGSSEEMT